MRKVNVRIVLVRNWWLLALRGLIAVLLGLYAFVWPGVALAVLVVLFGAFTLIHGLFSVWLAVGERRQSQRWWLLLIEGLVSIAVGVITFALTIVVLLYLVAIWACVIGLLEIVTALWRWRTLKHEWPLRHGRRAFAVTRPDLALPAGRRGAGIALALWGLCDHLRRAAAGLRLAAPESDRSASGG